MPKARDIKHLADDLKDSIEIAVSASAQDIHYSLQYVSPWWTGTFASAWITSKTPVKPGVKRDTGGVIEDNTPRREYRNPKKDAVIPINLGESLYVGNLAEYAGFVINERGQTLPNFEGEQVEYWEHAETVRAAGGDITPVPRSPEWYTIYLKHGAGRFLITDIDKGFKTAGFTVSN